MEPAPPRKENEMSCATYRPLGKMSLFLQLAFRVTSALATVAGTASLSVDVLQVQAPAFTDWALNTPTTTGATNAATPAAFAVVFSASRRLIAPLVSSTPISRPVLPPSKNAATPYHAA